MTDIKNVIAKCLGALWILDGLLQFQPEMFGQDFITNVLVPNLSSQPHWMVGVVSFGIYLWGLNTAFNNLGAGLLQVGIGLLLLLPIENKWFRFGAWISIVWGIVVWFCGEGAGLLVTGVASFYIGAPGAVLLYIVLAAILLVPELPLKRYVQIGATIFVFGAALQLQSAFWTVDGVQGAAMAAMMEPYRVLNAFPIYISNVLGTDPILANVLLALAPLALGVWLLWKPNKWVAIVALVFLFFVWWIGQDFGMLSTFPSGTGTDPSTAPLLALFLLPLLFKTYGATLEE